MSIIKSFEYFVDKNTKTLIIGTMPGKESLEKHQYYANERNIFWKIILIIFNDSSNFMSYDDKLACLKRNNIGLWDNLKYCERKGSLDNNIKNESPNDFESLLDQYKNLKYLIFNGKTSYKFFEKYHKDILGEYKHFILPSTSPTNASITFSEKFEKWKTILNLFFT